MTRSSGIEIVIRDCPAERILVWLNNIAGPLSETEPGFDDDLMFIESRLGHINLHKRMNLSEGNTGISVWFIAEQLPWASHRALALQAVQELDCVAVCDPGDDYPDVCPNSSIFLEVSRDGERLITIDSHDESSD